MYRICPIKIFVNGMFVCIYQITRRTGSCLSEWKTNWSVFLLKGIACWIAPFEKMWEGRFNRLDDVLKKLKSRK